MTNKKRPDWVHCVGTGMVGEEGRSWCGGAERPFLVDPAHAALNGRNGGRLVACRECVAAIHRALQNGHDDADYAEAAMK